MYLNSEYKVELDLYRTLIFHLISETKDQNLEIVSLRYLLSNFMTDAGKENMNDDILSGLYPTGCDQKDFDCFVRQECNGKSPFDDPAYVNKLIKAAHGERVDNHPNIYLPSFR